VKLKDITGQKFGRLTALYPTEQRKSRYTVWSCRCTCGNEKLVSVNHLLQGSVKSCGCMTTGRAWTEREVDELRLLVQTCNDKTIAHRLDRTVESIRGKRRLMGLYLEKSKRKKWSDKEIESLKLWLEEKKSLQYIAEKINRSETAIQRKVYKLRDEKSSQL
jgi:hypothetical protein